MYAATNQEILERITVFTTDSLEKSIVDNALRRGAESYICSYCSGKPLHSAIEQFDGGQTSLVRIELLADAESAKDILDDIHQLRERNLPVTAVVDSVTAYFS